MAYCVVHASSPDWLSIGARLDELLDGSDCHVLKRTPRISAGVAHLNGVDVFLKRAVNNSWSRGIIARIGGARARKTIRGARILQRAGFAHPKLIAAFEQQKGGSIRASFVILKYLRRPKVLSRFVLADGRDFAWRQRVSQAVA